MKQHRLPYGQDPETQKVWDGVRWQSYVKHRSYTYPADLCFVFGVPWDLPEFLLSMSELTLAPVPAASLLFPAAAEFRFVETQLPVIRTWTVAIRGGVLSDGRGRGS